MDRFDDIWKNRFNAADVPVDDWNTPDDQVWTSIAKTLPEQKRRKPIWFFILIGLLAIGLVAATYFSFNYFNEDKETNAQQYDEQITALPILKEINTVTDTPQQIENIEEKDKTVSIKNNTNLIVEPVSSFPSVKLNASPKKVKITDTFTNTPSKVNDEIQIPKEKIDHTIKITDHEVVEVVPTKKTLALSHRVQSLAISPISYQPELPSLSTKSWVQIPKQKIEFSINTGVVFWNHKLNTDLVTTLSPFDFNYEDGRGWNLDLEIGVPLNDYFKVFSGFNYERVSVKSGHNSALQYSLLNELDLSSNEYILSLATPYGFMGSDFQLQRRAAINEEEVDLLVDFKSNHDLQNISVPIGFMLYPLGEKRNYAPFFKTAFGVNYLASLSNDLDQIDTHHDALWYQSGSANLEIQDFEKWHIDVRFGAGFSYRLPRDISLSLQYDFTKGLSPVFNLDTSTAILNTKINRHHINLKLTKTIN